MNLYSNLATAPYFPFPLEAYESLLIKWLSQFHITNFRIENQPMAWDGS